MDGMIILETNLYYEDKLFFSPFLSFDSDGMFG